MRKVHVVLTVVAMTFLAARLATASGVKYENEDGDFVKLGCRIQLQYHVTNPDHGDSTDELFFRRIRPYIEGSLHEDWVGKFQFDFGKGELQIKDLFLKYDGVENFWFALGNMNFPFSQEFITSSKYQQLVERTFVGDHNYGTPDRQTGLHVGGNTPNKLLALAAFVGQGSIDPNNKKLDFDAISQFDAGHDWSDGALAGARLSLYPNGPMKLSQGDFTREFKTVVSVAGFGWMNDDDNLDSTRSNDVDTVTGFEVSAGVRGGGFSVDAEYNLINSELVDSGITSGLYRNSETTLNKYAVEGGYMVVPEKLELVAGYQALDADNYAKTWTRTSVGLNYFVAKQDIKYQFTYRMGANKDGKADNDVDEFFLQAQYVF